MKVVIDLSKLLAEGKITQADFDKLSQYALTETSSLAFNILVSFGVIAVTCAIMALAPSPITAIIIGLILALLGMLPLRNSNKWKLLSHFCTLIGSLLLTGGILWLYNGATSAWITVTIMLAMAGIAIQSGLLVIISILSLSATLGSGTGYNHAMYMIMIEQPTITIMTFGLLSYVFYKLSLIAPVAYSNLCVLASRTSIFLVNLAFLVGSLSGDSLPHGIIIPVWVFVVVWALALIATAIWASHANRRWVLNICAVFGAIHFYTQWFERLGATPTSVLFAGILALIFAFCIKWMNEKVEARRHT